MDVEDRHALTGVRWWPVGLFVGAMLGLSGAGVAQEPAQPSQPAQAATLVENVMTVPAGGLSEPELEVTVFRPPGPGPFPVMVVNHGRAPGNARFQSRFRPMVVVHAFASRGWAVVLPMRQGFSRSGGVEISAGCNVASNGEQQARSVSRTLVWLEGQPWADTARNVVMGQSHGGLATLAYGMAPHPGTKLLVNFAGGLRQEGCVGWQHELIRAIGGYGEKSRLPSLWFYGDNDSYFQPFVFREAHERYVKAGGPAELVAYGHFGSDAHGMFGSQAGLPIWLPKVLAALSAQGLPTKVAYTAQDPADIAAPQGTGFAALADVERVPLRNERGRHGYRAFLSAELPRAFAVHPDKGSWASAWGGERPNARALANCEKSAGSPCQLYAVDLDVVWRDK